MPDLKPNLPIESLLRLSGWPNSEAKAWTLQFARRACCSSDTAALLLIGSLARQRVRAHDVDLVYLYKRTKPRIDHPIDIDIRFYSSDEVPKLINEGHDLLTWALRFGRLICEHDAFWSALHEHWKGRIPLSSPEVAQERARKVRRLYAELLEVGDLEAANEQLMSLLTHTAWATLLKKGIPPTSRPELPSQLRQIDENDLAATIEEQLRARAVADEADV